MCIAWQYQQGRDDWEAKGEKRETISSFITKSFWSKICHISHSSGGALCVGTVQLSPAWMEVSILLIVTLLLLEAYRLPINIILLTARGVVSVWHVKFFQNRLFSSSSNSKQSEWMDPSLSDRRTLTFVCFSYTWVWLRLAEFACADKLMCVCRFVNDMR